MFCPLITEASKMASHFKQTKPDAYIILLILTDGVIHDMNPTINAIINAAYLPMSIIIIGIGNENFKQMVQLDGDEGLYNNQGVKAQRDLVQFVPFKKFQHKGPERLAQEVLEELPR